jgi:hypothetical protein
VIDRLTLAAALLTACALPAAATTSDAPGPLRADISVGYFTGDYGTGDTTDVSVVSPRLRWALPRGELRASFPLLNISTTDNVALIGGRPVGADAEDDGTPAPALGPATSAPLPRSLQGIGDVRVAGELDLLPGTATRPWLSGILELKIPTANEEDGLGTGEMDVEAGLRLSQPLGQAWLLVDASYTLVGDPDYYDYDDVVALAVGCSARVGASHNTQVHAFVENRSHPTPNRADRLDLAVGGSRRLGRDERMRLSVSAFVGLSDTAEDLGLALVFGRLF